MKNVSSYNRTDNRGYTLVEVIVVVAILAIAATALIKAFSTATLTNAKAQKMQNATSLAESVMEEVKSSSISQMLNNYNGGTAITITTADTSSDDIAAAALAKVGAGQEKLVSGGTALTPYYVLVKKDYVVPQGEKYNVTATIRTKPYSAVGKTDDALDANSLKLPVIEEIDTHTKTVLTSKELNKYDDAAKDYFYQHNGKLGGAGSISLAKKEIIIDKTGNGKPETGEVKVKCTVEYTASDNTTKYKKEVFNGTYVAQKDKDGNALKDKYGDKLPVDNSVYIFYNGCLPVNVLNPKETITINDSSEYFAEHYEHKVYVIFQKDSEGNSITNLSGTLIKYTDGTNNVFGVAELKNNSDLKYTADDGTELSGRRTDSTKNYWLITNLDGTTDGSFLEKKQKNRIYEVTVDVTKDGDSTKYATITSTVNVKE